MITFANPELAREFEKNLAAWRRENLSDRDLLILFVTVVSDQNARLDRIEEQQKSILEELMNTQADLDAGISTLTADDAAVLAAVLAATTAASTSFTDLEAKIAANPTAPVSDFSTEVATLAKTHTDLQSAITSLQAITAQATTDDPGAAAAAAPVAGTGTGTEAPPAATTS